MYHVDPVEVPVSDSGFFLATDEASGLSALGPTPRNADLNLQVAIRQSLVAPAGKPYAELSEREAAAVEYNDAHENGLAEPAAATGTAQTGAAPTITSAASA